MSVIPASAIAPLAAMGATWFARKTLSSIYARRTGHLPPQADDTEVSIASVILWTATTAVVSATIEVVITRMAAQYSDRNELTSFQEQDAITG